MKTLLLSAITIAILTSPPTANAGPVSYSYTALGNLGGAVANASAINNSGVIVGYATDTAWRSHAIIWDHGSTSILPVADGGSSAATAINDAGTIAGYSAFAQGSYRTEAFIWNAGTTTILDSIGGSVSIPTSINNANHVAGYSFPVAGRVPHVTMWNGTRVTDLGIENQSYTYGNGIIGSYGNAINDSDTVVGNAPTHSTSSQAMVWNGTAATQLDAPSWSRSDATAINDLGQVVGWVTDEEGGTHATVWNATKATMLADLGSDNSRKLSYASAINNFGDVVGSTSIGGDQHATIWRNGIPTDLNDFLDPKLASQGWYLGLAADINDHGFIVGTALNPNTGEQHAFLLSPTEIPEPASIMTFLCGLGLIGVSLRRRTIR